MKKLFSFGGAVIVHKVNPATRSPIKDFIECTIIIGKALRILIFRR